MRHERVILVILAYVIGFTTAYIAFGLQAQVAQYAVIETSYATPHTAHTVEREEAAGVSTPTGVELTMKEDGLFVKVDDTEYVISGRLEEGITPGYGFHTAVLNYALSPNEQYVYYCEQQQRTDNVCHNYLYVVGKHIIRPLKVSGEQLVSSVVAARFSWREDNVLVSPEYISESPAVPWILLTRNQL